MKYRRYVDEVGNSDLGASRDPNHRYLSLTGLILELGYIEQVVFPRLEDLKSRYFGSHPDDPIVLHRKEILNAKPPFAALRDPEVRAKFDEEILQLLAQLDYVAITVVIDKQAHVEQYTVWQHDPYHYCLAVLCERYALWLRANGETGDVMAESRGGREDRRLKDSFARVVREGTPFVSAATFGAAFTSIQLKVKPKANNIAGLQLADIVAHPAFRAALERRNRNALAENFGGKIAAILEDSKYRRSPSGTIDGWGRKWLP